MASLQVRISFTVDIPNETKVIEINSVLNSHAIDITDSFHEFCMLNKLPLNTQDDIEKAILSFAKQNKNNSLLLP